MYLIKNTERINYTQKFNGFYIYHNTIGAFENINVK
jgi:regulatory protein YycI of two-component signal transduction system YycFG